MTWNYRVMNTEHTLGEDNHHEHTATIHEVHYGDGDVSYTGEITPIGTGETQHEALLSLKCELLHMIEAVDYVLQNKTSVFDYANIETHVAVAESELKKALIPKYNVFDPDDDYMDEKYDE